MPGSAMVERFGLDGLLGCFCRLIDIPLISPQKQDDEEEDQD